MNGLKEGTYQFRYNVFGYRDSEVNVWLNSKGLCNWQKTTQVDMLSKKNLFRWWRCTVSLCAWVLKHVVATNHAKGQREKVCNNQTAQGAPNVIGDAVMFLGSSPESISLRTKNCTERYLWSARSEPERKLQRCVHRPGRHHRVRDANKIWFLQIRQAA
jgi:hypothetical protein